MSWDAGAARWQQVDSLFQQLLEQDVSERTAFLNEACGDDPELQNAVKRLLAHDDKPLGSLKTPVDEAAREVTLIGRRIGSYVLLRVLGEGGMGRVFLAARADDQYQQLVAVKLMHSGMWQSETMLQRFQRERQILASLNHPNIARLLDGGMTSDGSPYLVMEYVAGTPIDEYCRGKRLSIKAKLELFRTVCLAVEYAHKNLVVHRDIKPANVLVSEEGTPKLLDFGIAKLLDPDHDGQMPPKTRPTERLMTPEYASPEQLTGESITTATDVYGLGVLLYELLAGEHPYAEQTANPIEMARRICEVDPRPPSAVALPSPDRAHLHGDLDAITLKALEKDSARRYGLPSDLAADISRYLNNQPVLARPATAAYRARKYVRQHRIGVSMAAFLAVVLLSFAVAQSFELRRTRRERDRADRVTELMTSMFRVSDPSEARGNEIRAREILDKASTTIASGLSQDPELEAQMMHVVGTVYSSLGLYSRSEALLRQAAEIRRRVLGASSAATLTSMYELAGVLKSESRYAEAEKLSRETLGARRSLLGSEHRDTLESISQLASILNKEGRFREAEKLHREVNEKATRVFGPHDRGVRRRAMRGLAIDLAYEGKLAESERVLRELLESDRRALGRDHPDVLADMNNLAAALQREEKWGEAEKMYLELLPEFRRVNGPEHPYTLLIMGNLGDLLFNEKRYVEAEKLLQETLEIKRRVLGPEHDSTLITAGMLAADLQAEGQYSAAEKLFRKTLEMMRQTLGESHSNYLGTLYELGDLLRHEGRYAEAEQVLTADLKGRRRVLGDAHPDTISSFYVLSEVLAQEGKREEALRNLQSAMQHKLPPSLQGDLQREAAFTSLHGDPGFEALSHAPRW
ncbi:MAG: serine/threonine protein kinase [Acidobacteriaceae bacterium]|nr:serine/threonine protein kinase [Acidobacteriaceae bacterium]